MGQFVVVVLRRRVPGMVEKESDCGCCGEISGTQVDCRVFEDEGITRAVPTKKMLTDAILREIYHPSGCCCEEYQLPENLKRFFEGKEGKGSS